MEHYIFFILLYIIIRQPIIAHLSMIEQINQSILLKIESQDLLIWSKD